VLLFLRRNRRLRGGLKRHVVQVRYGLFFSAYNDDAYFWETVLTARKVGIVALSVFGRSIGTQRQAQMALFILFACIIMEIAGRPYRLTTDRHKVLGRLELASLMCLWGTMWCGTLIFASQEPGNEGFVVFLSFVVVIMNVGVLGWLVLRLVTECAVENKDSKVGKSVRRRLQSIGRRSSKFESAAEEGGAQVSVELSPAVFAAAAAAAVNQREQISDTGKCQSNPVWTREFDEASSRYFLHNKGTGESKWENEGGRYSQYETDEGVTYYVPEGGGESVWYLPENAEIVQ